MYEHKKILHKMALKFVLMFVLAMFLEQVSGHGMMLDPLNRASLWRKYDQFEPNYEDNQLYCGGFEAMYEENGGKCGVCGNNYADPRPRSYENTGTFGVGIITGEYSAGSVINVSVTLTANHLGLISYSLCVLKDLSEPEDEDCFEDLKFADGSDAYNVTIHDYALVHKVKLPENLTCDRCVLRWHYRGANDWGVCEDGTGALGCGAQETFNNCADISIE